jgi:hypothetical protein
MITRVAASRFENRLPGWTVRTGCLKSPRGHNWEHGVAQSQISGRPGHGFHNDITDEAGSCVQAEIILDSDTQDLQSGPVR